MGEIQHYNDVYRGPVDEDAWLAEMTKYLLETITDETFSSPQALEHRLEFICRDVRRFIGLKAQEKSN